MTEPPRRCPCLSGNTFADCCAPILSGERRAPTAERLMRSRFTAFALGEVGYLMRSWESSTRPEALELDEDVRWTRLDILDAEAGGPFDTSGVVEFVAHYRDADGAGSMRERSRFVRIDGMWFYLDGTPE